MMEEREPVWQEKVSYAKRKIKAWEAEYKSAHGSAPNKTAMAEAPDEVKAAYKAYRHYRKAMESLPINAGSMVKEIRPSFSADQTDTCSNECVTSSPTSQRDIPQENSAELNEISCKELLADSSVVNKDNITVQEIATTNLNPNGNTCPDHETDNSKNEKQKVISSDIWGKHLNKTSSRSTVQENKMQTSLYSKMAEKLRAGCSVKVRTSLKRMSSTSKLSNPSKAQNKMTLNSAEECLQSVKESDSKTVTPGASEEMLDIASLPSSPTEPFRIESVGPKLCPDNEGDHQSQIARNLDEPIGSSIFDSLEHSIMEDSISLPSKQKSSKHRYTQAGSSISPLVITHPHAETHTIKKRSSLNPGWLSRCTGITLPEITESKGSDLSSDGWKMKVIDKEWVEGISDEEAESDGKDKTESSSQRVSDNDTQFHEEYLPSSSPSHKRRGKRNPRVAQKLPSNADQRQMVDREETSECKSDKVTSLRNGRILRERINNVQDDEWNELPRSPYDFNDECNEEDEIHQQNTKHSKERDCDEAADDFETNVESEEHHERCTRKRKKKTLEELEASGEIEFVWPPPKKKRIGRKSSTKPALRKKTREHIDTSDDAPVTRKKKKKKENTEAPVRVQRPRKKTEAAESQPPLLDKDITPSDSQSQEYDETQEIETEGRKSINKKGRYMTSEERLQKKVATGTLNNNFVRINLKKKTFVRGKKNMTAAKYKRQEWKKKQMMKGAEKGKAGAIKSLTCYRCGDFGHWSKYCPGKIGDNLMPLAEYSEESSFLSLEDAASMAMGIKTGNSCEKPVTRMYNDKTGIYIPTIESKGEVSSSSDVTAQQDIPRESSVFEEVTESNEEQSSCSGDQTDVHLVSVKVQDMGKNDEANCLLDADDDIFADLEIDDIQNKDVINPNTLEHPNTLPKALEQTATTHSFESNRPTVDPLYSLDNGNICSTPEEVYEALKMFGYPSFRPGQENAIMRVLSGQSTLLVLSTGSGKSLCYQLPAYLYSKHCSPCITLCVSPLVSLMEDQVTGLPSFLHAVCLHTHQNATQRSRALSAIESGTANILLVSPEAVVASRSGGVLGTLLKQLPPVAFACLDEAHCVSEWSHNFRPSYLRVCQVLRERLGVRTILGLTATARQVTALSIARHLLVPEMDTGIIRGTSVPDNLHLSVSRDQLREQALITLLQGDRFSECSSVIVYCTRRDECERVATLIRTQLLDPSKVDVKSNLKRTRAISFDAESYHAGLSSSRRQKVQKQFMSGKLRIVVATVAFGMGIDKSDVQGIIHFNMPKNVESYVQEIGRAGRDGRDAHCHLFLDNKDGTDIQELKRHIYANSIDRHTVRKLLDKIFKPCTCAKVKHLEVGDDGKQNDSFDEEGREKSSNEPSTTNFSSPDSVPDNSVSENITESTTSSRPDPFSVMTAPSSCPKHEVAIPIDNLVEELDLPEENLATLLCYLELHQGNLIHLQSHVYANCSVSCYCGPRQLVAISRRCPPLAVAIALERQKGINFDNCNRVSFPVVEVASRMGWDSKIVKRELKSLEWNTQDLTKGGKIKRSGVNVEFTDLSFHLRARGDLTDNERDQILDAVYKRCQRQEKDQLRQLMFTYRLLRQASHNSVIFCCDDIDSERCQKLKMELREYFSKEGTSLSNLHLEEKLYVRPEVENSIHGTVRALLSTHTDQQWTGRAVARVLHGIGSPNFPSEVWGRVRRFWRQHLNTDFSAVVSIATREILRCK
ncbi:hypothetical protein Pcinc_034708 [Petrolisthes cinctipes]|uniref:DNA 3'-5' helicase n=1 Tax=Petrolisthes cinctipes TaxID=88211 RepID=A0AAE1BZT6_PETCI|nr:hypothetical protein Pcinc_034708 [Petrolisthes cinctipes]